MKKIIINGVNVSKCRFLDVEEDKEDYPEMGGRYTAYECVLTSNDCEFSNDCLYKKYQRKTAACEKLQEQISKIKEYVRHNMFDIDCENWFEIFIYTFEDWKKSILENENKYKKECEKHKQALDEIEKKCCAVLNGDEKILYAYQIKEIISKAKDGNNE